MCRAVFWVNRTRKRWRGIQGLERVKRLHYSRVWRGQGCGQGVWGLPAMEGEWLSQRNWGLRGTATARMLRSRKEGGLGKHVGPLFPPAFQLLAGVSPLVKSTQSPGSTGVSRCPGKRREWVGGGVQRRARAGRPETRMLLGAGAFFSQAPFAVSS